MKQPRHAFWSVTAVETLKELQTTPQGLSEEEAQERLARRGPNLMKPKKRTDALTLLLAQFKSPIILILLFAAALSLFLHDSADALIILIIVLVSGLLGFWQERGAVNAVEKLLAIIQIKATMIRDGGSKEVPVEEIVPGDIVVLNAGDVIPGDCLLLGIGDLGLRHCSRHSHPQVFLPEQTWEISAGRHSAHRWSHTRFPLQSLRRGF